MVPLCVVVGVANCRFFVGMVDCCSMFGGSGVHISTSRLTKKKKVTVPPLPLKAK